VTGAALIVPGDDTTLRVEIEAGARVEPEHQVGTRGLGIRRDIL